MQIVPFTRIRELVRIDTVIGPVRESFKSYSLKRAEIPPVQHLEMPARGHGALHIKSGYVDPLPFCLVKVASTFPENVRRVPPQPSINGLIAVFSTIDGRPLLILDDRAWITQVRTAGAGAVAAAALARPGAETLGIVGTGVQARLQASAALQAVPTLARVRIWGRTRAHAESCCIDLRQDWPRVSFQVAATAEEVARHADVLVTATYSSEPLVRGEWLREGVLVIAMGADSVYKRELDSAALLAADLLVVDSRSQNEILAEVGHGIREKTFTADRMDAELGEVLLGDRPALGRTSPSQRIICKLTGVAVQEIFVCAFLLEALGLDTGTPAPHQEIAALQEAHSPA